MRPLHRFTNACCLFVAVASQSAQSAPGLAEAELFIHLNTPPAVINLERLAVSEPVENLHPIVGTAAIAPPDALVRVDMVKLDFARKTLEQRQLARFTLNLGDDITFRAVFDTVTETKGGYVLSGQLAEVPGGAVTLSVRGTVVSGLLQTKDRSWSIDSQAPGVHAIRSVSGPVRCVNDHSSSDEPPLAMSQATRRTDRSVTDESAQDDGSEIDVLVLFTSEARRRNGYDRIRADIDLAVAATNQAYAVGQAVQRIRLVAAVEVSYMESAQINTTENARDDLYRLATPGDGHLDEAHRLRDQYAADIVYLVRAGPFGVGSLLNPQNSSAEEAVKGFAVGPARPPVTPMALFFAHELGHVMGLFHERWGGIVDNLHPYAYGYVNEEGLREGELDERRWYTIMAYGTQCRTLGYQCHQLMRFSNPEQLYPDETGDSLGVPGDERTDALDGPADAIRNLNETRSLVANFRASSTRCGYTLNNYSFEVDSEGGELVVAVATDHQCEWDVRSMDQFASLVTAAGTGESTVTVDVAPNDGFARIGFVTIAGETVLIRQRGGVPHVSVCDRSTHVREALVLATGRDSCEDVTEFDLLAVRELSISGLNSSLEFVPEDLQGLRYLVSLSFHSSGIRELPLGLFEGLESLNDLSIGNNPIDTIPADAFRGLGSLRHLDLSYNQISRLHADSFRGLASLAELNLTGNSDIQLVPNIFAPLSSLWYLRIEDVDLDRLEDPRIFSGLGRLLRLDMCRSGLTHIEDGVFEYLANLQRLGLCDNRLSSIHRQTFSGLENISYLHLSGNPINALPDDVFAEIPTLGHLWMWSTPIAALPPRVFDGTAPVTINLADSRIADVSGVRFPGERIAELDLSDSELIDLPAGMFSGFKSEACFIGELTLKLDGNPGTPFLLAPRLRRINGGDAATGPASVVVELSTGAPITIEVGVEAATDGEWRLLRRTTIPNGELQSEPFELDEDGYVQLRVSTLPDRRLPVTVQGLAIKAGASLSLFGFEDRNLVLGGVSHELDLVQAFAKDGIDNTDASFSVVSSDEEVATVSLSEGRLTIHPVGIGMTTITITVIGPDASEMSRTLDVVVHTSRLDHGGIAEAATLLTIGTPMLGIVADADDVDAFRVDLRGSATLEVRTNGLTDVRGELRNAVGALLVSDEDGGSDRHNFLLRADLDAGIYYVYVSGQPGIYSLVARTDSGSDHGGNAATATLLTLHAESELDLVMPNELLLSTSGVISPTTDDVDVFRFDVPFDVSEITVLSLGDTDVVTKLLDSSLREIASDMSDGNFRIEKKLTAGTYYVEVTGRETGDYNVLASHAAKPCPCEDDIDEQMQGYNGNELAPLSDENILQDVGSALGN